jgi:hypothetical protein
MPIRIVSSFPGITFYVQEVDMKAIKECKITKIIFGESIIRVNLSSNGGGGGS